MNNKNHTKLPILETERLFLRKLTPNDTEDFFEFASDPDIAELNTWKNPQTVKEAQAWMESMDEIYPADILFPWGIEYKANRRLIGICGFGDQSLQDNRADIFGMLSKNYWDQGIMTEAMAKVIAFGFNTLKLHRIEGKCLAENVAAEKVMQKLGMSLEGILKQYLWWNGSYHDLKWYAILDSEYGSYQRI